jgi:hypothetical protein
LHFAVVVDRNLRSIRRELSLLLQLLLFYFSSRAADASAELVAIGDFNDHPTDEGIASALGTVAITETPGGKMFNSMFCLIPDASNGTYVYKNKWEIPDQIVLSPGMLKSPGFKWESGSSKPLLVTEDQLFVPSGNSIPRPNQSYSGPIFHAKWISDHLPVGVTFERP